MDTFDYIQEELDSYIGEELRYSEASLSELKVAELKEILSSLNLPIYGTKQVLVKRLLDSQQEEVLEVESTIIIEKEVEEETNDTPTEPEYVEPVKGIKV